MRGLPNVIMNPHTRPDWTPPGTPDRRRRPAWLMPVLASAVAAVVTGGAVFGIAAFTGAKEKSSRDSASNLSGARHKAHPPTSAPLPAGIFVKVDRPCYLVSQQTSSSLVPHARFDPGKPEDDVVTGAKKTLCLWSNTYREADLVSNMRDLTVALHVYGGARSVSGAENHLNSSREFFKRAAGVGLNNPEFVSKTGPYLQVVGIGNEAVLQYNDLKSRRASGTPHNHTGQVGLVARYQNVIVDVTYEGSDSEANNVGKKTVVPLDQATARRGAETVAAEIVKSLAACSTCRG